MPTTASADKEPQDGASRISDGLDALRSDAIVAEYLEKSPYGINKDQQTNRWAKLPVGFVRMCYGKGSVLNV